jgi:hypothetical protein
VEVDSPLSAYSEEWQDFIVATADELRRMSYLMQLHDLSQMPLLVPLLALGLIFIQDMNHAVLVLLRRLSL